MKINKIHKKLKKHQLEAINVIENYLTDTDITKHAMIKIPTGAGKTGIIAIAANFYPNYSNVLILVPNAALPQQTKEEIDRHFWSNIDVDADALNLKPSYLYKNITNFIENQDASGSIIILTIQSLSSIYRTNSPLYQELQEKINLVIFDEGHREPAKEWSDINRELSKKTILFTATPYRNDDKTFKIHYDRHIYNYSHSDAINDSIINNLKINQYNSNFINDTQKITDFIISIFKKDRSQKTIVRINNAEAIEEIVKSINIRLGSIIALGCHTTLDHSDAIVTRGNDIYKHLDKSIFIHQDMLIEGLNVPSINNLIIISNFFNMKSFIQQVGRILRLTSKGFSNLYVPEVYYDYYENQWSKYIKYDQNGGSSNIHYHDGEFKELIKFDSNFYKYLRLPKAGNFFIARKSLLNYAIDLVKSDLIEKQSITNLSEYRKDHIWVMCYEKLSYSDLLNNKVYSEKTFECSIICEYNNGNDIFLVHYDSRGHSFPIGDFNGDLKNISIEMLNNLYPNNSDINDVKLSSVGISNTGINSRNLKGIRIENLNTNINERLSYCNAVKGRISKSEDASVNRYVGMLSSRINDNARVDLNAYENWISEIIDSFGVNSNNSFFKRFACVVVPSKKLEPTSLLIDLNELVYDDKCSIKKDGIMVLGIESITANIIGNKFNFTLFNRTFTGDIECINHKNSFTYNLNIPVLAQYKLSFSNTKYPNLIDLINGIECYKVFFGNDGIIYHEKKFFKPNITFANVDLNSLDIGKRIYSLNGLDLCIDEKFGSYPNRVKVTQWQKNSMFGFILSQIKNRNGLFANYNFTSIMCDDLEKEIADFIAIDSISNKIVLIHIKNNKSVGSSASAFQDVCGQAQKNIHYLINNDIENKQNIEDHIKRWDTTWNNTKKYEDATGKPVEVKFECKRRCKGRLKGNGFWESYKNILKSPDVSKEVWLITKSLSRQKLVSELNKEKPEEHINQLLWILYGTQEVLGEVGADLKVICCE